MVHMPGRGAQWGDVIHVQVRQSQASEDGPDLNWYIPTVRFPGRGGGWWTWWPRTPPTTSATAWRVGVRIRVLYPLANPDQGLIDDWTKWRPMFVPLVVGGIMTPCGPPRPCENPHEYHRQNARTLYFFRSGPDWRWRSMIGLGYWQRTILDRAIFCRRQSRRKKPKRMAMNSRGLGVVNLSGSPVTDSDLAHLAPLFQAAQGPSSLDLSRTRITDAGLAHLRSLDRTTTLNLSGTTIDGSGLAHLALLGTQSLETGAADVTLKLAGHAPQ